MMNNNSAYRSASFSLTHDAYRIGWICALPCELTAAIAVLDEEYPPLGQASSDTHNIVITCLPAGQMVTTPASIAATNLQRTFENIKVGLMIGIGGAVPFPGDLRLGDVAISKPNANASNGGIVIHYGTVASRNSVIKSGVMRDRLARDLRSSALKWRQQE